MTGEARSPATPRPWRMAKMMEGAEQMRPEGMTPEQGAKWDALMAERNQPSRDNNGSWIIVGGDPGTESYTRVAATAFKGTAKRGQAYCAPDPVGFANAELIVAAVNAYDPEALARPLRLIQELRAENARLREALALYLACPLCGALPSQRCMDYGALRLVVPAHPSRLAAADSAALAGTP